MSWAIHQERPGRRKTLGLLASTVLIALVVGMPLWLVITSGPPSFHLEFGHLRQALEHHRPGDVQQVAAWLGKASLLLAWIAWAWLTLCVVLEIAAWRSGHSTFQLPASRSIQGVAALLVGTAFAVGSLGRVPVHVAGGTRSVPIVLRPSAVAPNAATESDPPGHHGARSADAGGATGWSPDRAPGNDDADERLVSPTRRLVDDPAPAVPGSSEVFRHTVTARESLWSIAEQRLGAARRWRDIAELNYGRPQAGGGALDADHWLQPGWELLLPTVDGQSLPVPEVSGRGPSAGTAPSAPDDPAPPVPPPPAPGGVPAAPVGAGIVGVGVADLVDRLRRVQQRHRARGGQIRLPEHLLRQFEQRLRLDAGAADLAAVEAAVATLADGPNGWPEGCRLTGATVGADEVKLVFDVAPVSIAPSPFTLSEDGVSLSVERVDLGHVAPLRRADRHRFSAPTLVSVGRTDGILAMIDVEGLGGVAIAGDPVAAEGLGRAMALELASSRWASGFDLVLVGFGAALANGDRVTVVGDAAPVIADLAWRRLMMAVQLDDSPEQSVDAARRTDPSGDWRPTVVVCAPVVPRDHVTAILELASDGRLGICAVAMAGAEGRLATAGHLLRVGPTLEVLGATVEAQSVDGVELDQATQLIETAAHLDAPYADESGERDVGSVPAPVIDPTAGTSDRSGVAPYRRRTESTTTRLDLTVAGPRVGAVRTTERAGHRSVAASVDLPGIEVELSVLGTVEVHGAARKFTRAWALELVVYLAMHPGGASNEAWATALWPDRLMAPSSLHSTVSVARRALGSARDGSDHLPRSHGRLALASTVGTDWARFQKLAESDDPDRWEAALTVVRGRPFDGIRATDWSLLDGTAPSIEAAVVDLSGRLAGARLRSGDPYGAEWAARKGLLVSPYDERLYRMLLRTADAAGNPEGVETVMAELVRVVADEVEPVESVHPSTLALYRALSRRSRPVVEASPRG